MRLTLKILRMAALFAWALQVGPALGQTMQLAVDPVTGKAIPPTNLPSINAPDSLKALQAAADQAQAAVKTAKQGAVDRLANDPQFQTLSTNLANAKQRVEDAKQTYTGDLQDAINARLDASSQLATYTQKQSDADPQVIAATKAATEADGAVDNWEKTHEYTSAQEIVQIIPTLAWLTTIAQKDQFLWTDQFYRKIDADLDAVVNGHPARFTLTVDHVEGTTTIYASPIQINSLQIRQHFELPSGTSVGAGATVFVAGTLHTSASDQTSGFLLDIGLSNCTLFQPPTITSSPLATFTVGQPGLFAVATNAAPAPLIKLAGALPDGVSFADHHDGTATISGTPAANTGGQYPILISAANGYAPDGSQKFVLSVDQSPAITSAPQQTILVGQPVSLAIATTGYPAPTLGAAGLPPGLALSADPHGGTLISGTVPDGSGGSYAVAVSADNGISPPAKQTLTLLVNQPPAFTSSASATFEATTGGRFTVNTAGYPVPAITETGDLPRGIMFTDNHDGTATLAGTPLEPTGDKYTVQFQASNGVGGDATQSFTVIEDIPQSNFIQNLIAMVKDHVGLSIVGAGIAATVLYLLLRRTGA